MTSKKRSISSKIWLREHFSDKYAQKSQKEKLRSRARFKLSEIQKSDKVLKPGMTVIDLGSSPGGWSKYAKTQIGKTGRIIACDYLPMNSISGVNFFQGDCNNKLFLNSLLKYIGGKKVQIVMSDMAPNMSGISEIDIPNAMHLVELAMIICLNVLELNGTFIVKMFYGEGFEDKFKEILSLFKKVKIRKPIASRGRSREVYVVATERKM